MGGVLGEGGWELCRDRSPRSSITMTPRRVSVSRENVKVELIKLYSVALLFSLSCTTMCRYCLAAGNLRIPVLDSRNRDLF